MIYTVIIRQDNNIETSCLSWFDTLSLWMKTAGMEISNEPVKKISSAGRIQGRIRESVKLSPRSTTLTVVPDNPNLNLTLLSVCVFVPRCSFQLLTVANSLC